MLPAIATLKARLSLTEILYGIFLVSLTGSFRAITSISTGLILLTGIVLRKPSLRSILRNDPRNQFATGCILFFLLQIIPLFYTHDIPAGWNDLRLKSGLVFLPLALLAAGPLPAASIRKLLFFYCGTLFFAALILPGIALAHYRQSHNTGSIFYYELVSPVGYHPVYFSILVFAGLAFLLENFPAPENLFQRILVITAILLLSVFLFLLASKLVISFYLFYLIFYLGSRIRKYRTARLPLIGSLLVIVVLSTIVLVTRNPVSERFRDIVHGNISLATQDRFTPAVYFNGIQFRLLEWKLVPAILNDYNCWWTGVGAGDAQAILNEEYLSRNMYAGEPGRTGHGYLGYNTHNQFLESLLQNGIPGLTVFCFIYFSMVKIAWQLKKRMVSFTIILLLIYSFLESLFQEQYGIVILIFFTLFLSQDGSEPVSKTGRPLKRGYGT